MQTVTTIGLDIAKSVFQVHGVDAGGNVVIRRQLKRRYVMTFFRKLSPCLVGIEACASSHHWSRELQAIGHSVRLMPAAFGGKADAELNARRGAIGLLATLAFTAASARAVWGMIAGAKWIALRG
jgi:transposase